MCVYAQGLLVHRPEPLDGLLKHISRLTDYQR
jgi:hypothetical protein